jgi:hypothetical protein
MPMDMIRQGWSMSLFQASQQRSRALETALSDLKELLGKTADQPASKEQTKAGSPDSGSLASCDSSRF